MHPRTSLSKFADAYKHRPPPVMSSVLSLFFCSASAARPPLFCSASASAAFSLSTSSWSSLAFSSALVPASASLRCASASSAASLSAALLRSNLSNLSQNVANFWRARPRLYQSESLQENMRLAAFFKLYKMCILLHRCNLKIFAKNRFEKSAIFVEYQQNLNFADVAKFGKLCQISRISA